MFGQVGLAENDQYLGHSLQNQLNTIQHSDWVVAENIGA